MCGFIGALYARENTKLPINSELLSHRGPDDSGEYEDESVHFQFRRLSIQDTSSRGHQPMQSKDGRYTIIFNGEIYNYIESRNQLLEKGYTFESGTDTEVLLALYQEKGEEMVSELRGMFAFAIWDKEEKSIFAARDHFGIKPFYFVEEDGGLVFASEKKCLLDLYAPKNLNHEALQHYFTFQYVPNRQCLVEPIKQLKPGHLLKKKVGQVTEQKKYFQATFQPNKEKSMAYYIEETKRVLSESVEKHMRSDVPVGSFLSGGVDSTSIVALAKQHNEQLETFTVGFEREGYSEIDLAKESAEELGVKNTAKLITPQMVLDEIETIIWHMDEPIADPAAIPNFFVAKEAAKKVKVVLSGEGSDELLTGYRIYREPESLKVFDSIPKQAYPLLRTLSRLIPEGVKGRSFIERGTTALEERYVGNAKIFDEAEKKQLLKQYNDASPYTAVTESLYGEVETFSNPTKMQYVDVHTWLPDDILAVADRMTMAHSLELRVPFLDKEVYELASRIPTEYNLSQKTTKYILREAMKDSIPHPVTGRKKVGFPVPIRHWLANEWYDWAKNLIQESSVEKWLDKAYILDLLEVHASGKKDYGRHLWTVIVFIIWHQLYVE